MEQQSLGKILVLLGVMFLVCGIFFIFRDRLPGLERLGKLPGDIHFQKDNVSFYFPITTSILLSAVLSFVLWLLRS